MNNIYKKVAAQLNLPYRVVKEVYRSYWLFIKTKIEELPLKQDYTEEEFDKLKKSFNLPYLGKFYCDYKSWSKKRKLYKILTNEH